MRVISSSSSSPLCWCSGDKATDRFTDPQESVELEAAGTVARNAQTSLTALERQANAPTTFQTPAIGHDGNTYHIRVVDIGGDPWFVAADVCRALGMRADATNGSFQNHYRRLATDERRPSPPSVLTTRGTLISESGLYKLILRSDKPQAKPFQDWVTRVVLPAIRKDGGYIMGEEKVARGEMSEKQEGLSGSSA